MRANMMSSRIRVAGGFALMLMYSIAVAQEATLDLTQPAKTQPSENYRPVISARTPTSSDDVRPWPLRVRLLQPSRTAYTAGEPIVYEVELEALAEITLPWSNERYAVDPTGGYDAPAFRYMTIQLEPENGSPIKQLAATAFAYGSALVPGSLKIVRTGEKVRIRIGGHWQSVRPESDGAITGALNLRAILTPALGDLLLPKLISENALRISTRPYQ